MANGRNPRDELQLIEQPAGRSGGDSAALFGAFDLSTAYHGAGKYNSKRTKIAAALQEARSQGRIDEVLDAVAELVGMSKPPVMPRQLRKRMHIWPATRSSLAMPPPMNPSLGCCNAR